MIQANIGAPRLTSHNYEKFKAEHRDLHQRLGQNVVNYFGLSGAYADILWDASTMDAEHIIQQILA